MSSGNAMLDGILWGDWRWPSSDVTYYFAHQNEGFEGYSRNWSSVEQNAYRTALQSWANVANVTFTEVSSPAARHLSNTWCRNGTSNGTSAPCSAGMMGTAFGCKDKAIRSAAQATAMPSCY